MDCLSATIVTVLIKPEVQSSTASQYVVRLICNDNNCWQGEREFIFSASGGESMYATALTALSLGKSVKVKLAAIEAYSLIELLEINPA